MKDDNDPEGARLFSLLALAALVLLVLSQAAHAANTKASSPSTKDVYDLVWDFYANEQAKVKNDVKGTEYVLGQQAVAFTQLTYANGSALNNQSCIIDIYSPASGHPEIVNDAVMLPKGEEGLHYYDWTPTLVGIHMMSATCQIGGALTNPDSEVWTVRSPATYSGNLTHDMKLLDEEYITITPSGNNAEIEHNQTFTSITNVSVMNAVANLIRNDGTLRGVQICVWDYKLKKYTPCANASVDIDFPQTLSVHLNTNSTGDNYLDGTAYSNGTVLNGVFSIKLNATAGNNNNNWFVDYLYSNLYTQTSQIQELKGAGEAHVWANFTLDVPSTLTANVTVNTNNTAVLNAIYTANTSLHTALSSNYSGTLAKLGAIEALAIDANSTIWNTRAILLGVGSDLHYTFDTLNASLYNSNASLTSYILNTNSTAALAWLASLDAEQAALAANVSAYQAWQAALNADADILAVGANLTLVNQSLTSYIQAINATVYVTVNDTNFTAGLGNLTALVLDTKNNTEFFGNVTVSDYALDREAARTLERIVSKLDYLTTIVLDTWKRVGDVLAKVSRNALDSILGR